MRTVLAGCLALAGCPDDVFDALDASGVCEARYDGTGSLCYEHLNNSNVTRRQCDEETSTFVEDATCADLGYSELCQDRDDMKVFGDSAETCAAFTGEVTTVP